MPQTRNAPNSARRSEKSRRAILTAALDLVEESGYAKLSIEGIAARAGAGKQTIYRWWPSKGAVLLDALLALSESQEGEVMSLPDTGDLEADLKQILRATVEQLNDPRYDQPMRALSTEILRDPALAAVRAELLDDPLTALRQQRLRSAQQAGELPPTRPRAGRRPPLGTAVPSLGPALRAADARVRRRAGRDGAWRVAAARDDDRHVTVAPPVTPTR